MSKGTTIRMWRRSLTVLIGLIFIGFGVIACRLFKLQIVDGADLKQRALDQQLKDTMISAKRGTIYDCNMKPLAQSATVWSVVFEPAYLKDEDDKKTIVEGLSSILDIDKDELYKKANQHSYYTVIKRKIESDIKDKIIQFQKDKNINNGIRLIEDYKRYYPYGSFASPVIGFTGADNQGLTGLETYYDKYLTGEPGRLVTARNAIGTDMPFDYEQRIEAQNGYNLILYLDEVIQHFLEKNLQEGVINNKVMNRAAAIMMDVNTGAILGMAVKGDFDLNDPFTIVDEETRKNIDALPEEEKSKARGEALQKQWRNKAISDTYIPGSVFKIITASMGFEEGVVTEETPFYCSGSIVPFKNAHPIHCHERSGHGAQTFVEALCHSCNPAFVQLAQMLGVERFYKYYSSFGFTKKTGIDLPGETNGIFFSTDGSMAPMDLAVSGFGQNFSITPIQMITAVASVANGGNLVSPHVVKQIVDDNGNIIKSASVDVKRQVISKQTSDRMRKILQKNAIDGSGKNGYVAGYRIAGKTGTSEKKGSDANLNGNKDYVSSYCGFAPADNPQIALLVLYDTPRGGDYYGSLVAAPTFARVMEEVLPYLGVERKYTEKEIENIDMSTPFVVGSKVQNAKNELSKIGLDPIVYGNGEIVVSQIPEASSKIPKGGRVILYTDADCKDKEVTVPKLVGMSIVEVNREAANARINVSLTGVPPSDLSAISISQSIPEGEKVSPGTVVSVGFAEKDRVE